MKRHYHDWLAVALRGTNPCERGKLVQVQDVVDARVSRWILQLRSEHCTTGFQIAPAFAASLQFLSSTCNSIPTFSVPLMGIRVFYTSICSACELCEGCLVVGCDHGPQAEVAQGVGPGPLVER